MRHWQNIAVMVIAGAFASTAFASPYSDAEIDRLNDRLAPVAARVQTAAAELCREMDKRNCAVDIVLDPKAHGINAHADGRHIVVNPAMVAFAQSDEHLAFVLAHESAHQIMGHLAAQREAQALLFLNTMDGQPTRTANFEREADYIGLYITARAGYRVERVGDLWGQLSHAQMNTADSYSHPSNPARSHAMQKTVAEIRTKQRQHIALMPNLV